MGYAKNPAYFRKENIAKPLLGMANAAGGVVLYGIPPGAVKVGGRDVPGNPEGILPVGLEQAIGDVLALQVSPPIDGCETRVHADSTNKKQVLAAFVPQSANAPHQSSYDHLYYRRCDDDTKPMDHVSIELLFRAKHGKELNLLPVLAPHRIHLINAEAFRVEMVNSGNSIALNLKAHVQDLLISQRDILAASNLGTWPVFYERNRPEGMRWASICNAALAGTPIELTVTYSDLAGAQYKAEWALRRHLDDPRMLTLATEVILERIGILLT